MLSYPFHFSQVFLIIFFFGRLLNACYIYIYISMFVHFSVWNNDFVLFQAQLSSTHITLFFITQQSLQSSYLFTTATTSATSTAAMDHNAGFHLAILNLMAELDSVEMAGALKVGWGGVVHDFVDDF